MGKGDQKTRRGKLFRGSYGVRRPKRKSGAFSVVGTTVSSVPKQAKKEEPVSVKIDEPKAEKPLPVETVEKEEPKAKKPRPAGTTKKKEPVAVKSKKEEKPEE